MITTIGFDGDDTLWHNETIFSMTQDKFRQLLLRYVPGLEIDKILYITELRNLKLFGYGIKGFTLSMIETAIEVSQGRVNATDIQRIIDFGKAMLDHPVELVEGAAATLDRLRGTYQLILITKGDLFDQESKLARSGLADSFGKIEILSEKDERTYRHLLDRHGVAVENFLMVGNSLKSDVLPVLSIGGHAVHIPYPVTWIHEEVNDRDRLPTGYRTLARMADLPGLLEALDTRVVAIEPG